MAELADLPAQAGTNILIQYAEVLELADRHASGACAHFERVGSNPTFGTLRQTQGKLALNEVKSAGGEIWYTRSLEEAVPLRRAGSSPVPRTK